MTLTQASLDDQLSAWFASDPEAIANGPDIFRAVRETAPIYRVGASWVLTHYDLIKELTSDNVHFSNDHSRRGSRAQEAWARLQTDEERTAFREVMEFEHHFMNRNDGDAHRRLRGTASAALTPKRVQSVIDQIDGHAEAAIAGLEAQGDGVVDFVPFMYEVPLRVICDLIGVPAEDRPKIKRWGGAITANRFATRPKELVGAWHAWREILDYVKEMIDRYKSEPGEGDALVTALMSAHGGDRLSADEITSLFVMLLQGGHETTSNLIGIGTYYLLRQREQYEILVNDPSLVDDAIEELLRYVSPAQTANRRCEVATEIAGQPIAVDETVIGLLGAANRDPAVFPNPEKLDVRRPEAKRHLTFSFGPHFCLGASLARAEAKTVFRKLVTRFPDLQLAADHVDFIGPSGLRSLAAMPVTLGR